MMQRRLFLVAIACPVSSFLGFPSSSKENRSATKLHGDKSVSLVFQGEISVTSDPIDAPKNELEAFLAAEGNRDLILSLGGKRPLYKLEKSEEMMLFWKEACDRMYGPSCQPEEGDDLLASESSFNFPGLRLVTTVAMAVKTRKSSSQSPGCEIFVLAEKKEPRGPAPLVWVFNTLTGANKQNATSFQGAQSQISSKLSVASRDNGSAFAYHVNVRITTEFPSFLLRILPVTKEKAEEQGTNAVMKVISKDVNDAMVIAREAFLKDRAGVCSSES